MDAANINQLLTAARIDDAHPAMFALSRDSIESTSRKIVFEQAARLAGGLEAAGLERGGRVVIIAPNSVDWLVSLLGILQAGGVIVPLDTQMPREDLHHALNDCDPQLVFTTVALLPRLETSESLPKVYLLDADEADADTAKATRRWASLLDSDSIEPRAEQQDQAAIFYTSGTTGPPKGVPLTHDNIGSNVEALCTQGLADSRDRLLVPLPFHHVYPFTVGILIPLFLGAPIIIPLSLVGPQIVRALREGEATVMLGVPRLYEAIWRALHERVSERGALAAALFNVLLQFSTLARERFDWRLGKRLFGSLHQRVGPDLRLMVAGGAALDPELARKLRGIGWDVATGYGLSETSPILTMNPPDKVRLKSAGKALPGVELRIDAQEGESRGEVLARGPNVFSGYRNLPDKTTEDIDEQGWFHTGDVGSLDKDGFLYLHGRKSAMIVLAGGENIDPEKVESTLAAASKLREVGVLEAGDRLAAVVVPEPGVLREAEGDALRRILEEAVDEAARELPSHHRPRKLRIALDPLPRTRLGKLRRHKLQELFEHLEKSDEVSTGAPEPIDPEEMAPEDAQLLSDPAAEGAWRYLAERFHDIRLTPDTSLARDLGIDSLGWVDLTLSLRQHAGIDLDDAAISRVQTVRDLLNEAAAAAGASEERGEDLVNALKHPEDMLDQEQKALLADHSRSRHLARSGLWGVSRLATHSLLRISVSGSLPPGGPFVIAPRHLSVLDPLVLVHVLDRQQLKSLYWSGWTGLMHAGFVTRWFSRTTSVLPIDPGSAPRRSLSLAAICLERGHSLVWFPEGQRSPDGELKPFKPGLGLVLRAQPVPVVPVWIEGTDKAMPPGQRLPRPAKVQVVIGDAILPERLADSEDKIAEQLHDAVAALGQALRK